METQTVLITGSSRGIGKSIAYEFIKNNYKVILNCISNEEKMLFWIEELKKINKNIIGIRCDVSNYEETKNMFSAIETTFGSVDVLVNNAGVSHIGLFSETSPSLWQHIINTNLNSVLNCSHLAVSSMVNKKSGSIINISSIWGNAGASCEAIYSASKGGVNSFTKALAKELAPSNVRVNAISCGVINTEMNNCLNADEKKELQDSIPFMRFGDPVEVAKLAFFLSQKDCSYLTGQIINIDGGYL